MFGNKSFSFTYFPFESIRIRACVSLGSSVAEISIWLARSVELWYSLFIASCSVWGVFIRISGHINGSGEVSLSAWTEFSFSFKLLMSSSLVWSIDFKAESSSCISALTFSCFPKVYFISLSSSVVCWSSFDISSVSLQIFNLLSQIQYVICKLFHVVVT